MRVFNYTRSCYTDTNLPNAPASIHFSVLMTKANIIYKLVKLK